MGLIIISVILKHPFVSIIHSYFMTFWIVAETIYKCIRTQIKWEPVWYLGPEPAHSIPCRVYHWCTFFTRSEKKDVPSDRLGKREHYLGMWGWCTSPATIHLIHSLYLDIGCWEKGWPGFSFCTFLCCFPVHLLLKVTSLQISHFFPPFGSYLQIILLCFLIRYKQKHSVS